MTLLHEPDLSVAPPRLTGIDHLEWWVGNARTFAGFLCSAFGFAGITATVPTKLQRSRTHIFVKAAYKAVCFNRFSSCVVHRCMR